MTYFRITLISNARQTQKATFLLFDVTLAGVFTAAKKELRLNKPSRLFLPGGEEVTHEFLQHLQNGVEFLVSCGEDYIGKRKTILSSKCEIIVIANKSYVDPCTVQQLRSAALLHGMIQVVGMPDLHPGIKSPIGAVFVSRGYVHPHLIGGDIGCGMAVYRTSLTAKDVTSSEVTKLADRLRGIEGPWEGHVRSFLSWYMSLDHDEMEYIKPWETSLGTIGGGNHFAELQQITEATEEFSLDEVVLVVHSGSRGLGHDIGRRAKAWYKAADIYEYSRLQWTACQWAEANRDLIALRFLSRIYRRDLRREDVVPLKVLDIWHNKVEQIGDLFYHRKGAAPATAGMVIIPGSRGTLSAYVKPIPTSMTAFSVAHGAGRAQSRSSALEKLSNRYRPEDLTRTPLGGWVICEDKELIYEEAPEGYKEVETVVADMVDASACKVIAWGMPRVSYKMRK